MSIYSTNTTLQTIYLYLITLYLWCNNLQRCYICNPLLSKQNLLSQGFHAGNPFWFVVFLPYCILLGDYPVAKTDNYYYVRYSPAFLKIHSILFLLLSLVFSIIALMIFAEVNFLKSLMISDKLLVTVKIIQCKWFGIIQWACINKPFSFWQ